MNLNILQSLLIGFVSGLTQILPVSAEAHRTILYTLFGIDSEDAVFRFLVHTACLIALSSAFRADFQRFRRASQLMRIPPRRRRKPLDPADANTVRLLRTGMTGLIVCRLIFASLGSIRGNLNLLPAGLIVTGILLLIPRLVRNGNMNSRNMPRFLGFLMGLGGGLGGIPGFSSVGCAMSIGQWQGVDRQYAMNFSYYLLMPGLVCHMVLDVVDIVLGNAAVFSGAGLVAAFAGAIAAAFGSRAGLRVMQGLAQRAGFSLLAYYCWGLAMLCFALFLSI